MFVDDTPVNNLLLGEGMLKYEGQDVGYMIGRAEICEDEPEEFLSLVGVTNDCNMITVDGFVRVDVPYVPSLCFQDTAIDDKGNIPDFSYERVACSSCGGSKIEEGVCQYCGSQYIKKRCDD